MKYTLIPPRWLYRLWGLWFPFLGAGITISKVSDDFRFVQTKLKLRWWNKNYVGTQYGGSMFSMTDPIFMVMLLQILGPEYIVWDKAASIRYLKPGKTDLTANFSLDESTLADIREKVASFGKLDWTQTVQIKDRNGEVVAEVDKVLYIRKKKPKA